MRINRKLTPEHREKIRNSLKGKKRDEQTKKKISQSMKRYWETVPAIEGENKEFINDNDAQTK